MSRCGVDVPLSINQVCLVVGTVPERVNIKKNCVRSPFLELLCGASSSTSKLRVGAFSSLNRDIIWHSDIPPDI